MVMGVLPNLLIIAILISNCTSAPNGAISYNTIQDDWELSDNLAINYIAFCMKNSNYCGAAD